jgi:hypothetical protein
MAEARWFEEIDLIIVMECAYTDAGEFGEVVNGVGHSV